MTQDTRGTGRRQPLPGRRRRHRCRPCLRTRPRAAGAFDRPRRRGAEHSRVRRLLRPGRGRLQRPPPRRGDRWHRQQGAAHRPVRPVTRSPASIWSRCASTICWSMAPSRCSSWTISRPASSDPETALALVEGVAEGCRDAGCALIGGETLLRCRGTIALGITTSPASRSARSSAVASATWLPSAPVTLCLGWDRAARTPTVSLIRDIMRRQGLSLPTRHRLRPGRRWHRPFWYPPGSMVAACSICSSMTPSKRSRTLPAAASSTTCHGCSRRAWSPGSTPPAGGRRRCSGGCSSRADQAQRDAQGVQLRHRHGSGGRSRRRGRPPRAI